MICLRRISFWPLLAILIFLFNSCSTDLDSELEQPSIDQLSQSLSNSEVNSAVCCNNPSDQQVRNAFTLAGADNFQNAKDWFEFYNSCSPYTSEVSIGNYNMDLEENMDIRFSNSNALLRSGHPFNSDDLSIKSTTDLENDLLAMSNFPLNPLSHGHNSEFDSIFSVYAHRLLFIVDYYSSNISLISLNSVYNDIANENLTNDEKLILYLLVDGLDNIIDEVQYWESQYKRDFGWTGVSHDCIRYLGHRTAKLGGLASLSKQIYMSNSEDGGPVLFDCPIDTGTIVRGALIGGLLNGLSGALTGAAGGTVVVPVLGTVSGAVGGFFGGFAKGMVTGAVAGLIVELMECR